MNIAGSRAIARLLCKTVPPRRIVTLNSKTANLQYPNCIRFSDIDVFMALVKALTDQSSTNLVHIWLGAHVGLERTVTLGSQKEQYHLRQSVNGTCSILLEHYDSLATILDKWQTLSIRTRSTGLISLSVTPCGTYTRDSDILCQIEFFMASEAMDRNLRCPFCPYDSGWRSKPI